MSCRSCGRDALDLVLSLGRIPLANALLTLEDLKKPEERFPLDVAFCPRCSLVQLREEQEWGAGRRFYYRMMAHRVTGMRESLKSFLEELKGEGSRIVAYGAAAKGATLLNCFGIGQEYRDYAVDRSPHKQGRFMPGVTCPTCCCWRGTSRRRSSGSRRNTGAGAAALSSSLRS